MKKCFILFLSITSLAVFCQKKDTVKAKQKSLSEVKFVNNIQTLKYEQAKSKSTKTAKATIIEMTKQEVANVSKVQDLVKIIPQSCDIVSSAFTVKGKEGAIREFVNIGSNILMIELIRKDCVFIVIDNIVSKCPASHYANYKILIN